MKKILNILILAIMLIPFVASAKDFYNIEQTSLEEALKEEGIAFDDLKYNKSGVNIYLFRGRGCTYCRNFLEFASTTLIEEKGEYINFVTYEVWYNSYNKVLYDAVKEHFGITRDGVPLIVIGDNYLPGYSKEYSKTLYDYIDEEVKNDNKNDIIKKLLNGEELSKPEEKQDDEEPYEEEVEPETKKEKTLTEKIKDYYEENKTVIILGSAAFITTFFTLVLVIVLLVVYKKVRKQNIVTDREIKEDKEEKVKE